MSEKRVYTYPNGATLIYYQQNVNKSTNATIGFKVPMVDIPYASESIFRYKNVITYWDQDGKIRVPLVKPGIIHCAEHMFFKNLPKMKKEEIYKTFQRTDTIYNAHTTQESVCMEFDTPTKFVEEIFSLYSDMMLRNKFDQKELNEEKEVIYQELQQSLDYDRQHPILAYFKNNYSHLTGSEILGMYKDIIDSISPNELKRFCRTHFTTENLIMSVVSDLPFEEVKKLCDKYFVEKIPSIPESKVILQPKRYNFDRDQMMLIPSKKQDSKTVTLEFVFKGSNDYETNEKFSYVEDYLFNGFTGRLFKTFRLKNQLTYTPFFNNVNLANLTLKDFIITTTPEFAGDCIFLFTDMLSEILEKGISQEEFEGFKEMWINHRERKTNLKAQNSENLFYLHLQNLPVYVSNMYDKIKDLTIDDINNYLREVYIKSPLFMTVMGNFNQDEIPPLDFVTAGFRPYNKYALDKLYVDKELDEFYDFLENGPSDPNDENEQLILIKDNFPKQKKKKSKPTNNQAEENLESTENTSNTELTK